MSVYIKFFKNHFKSWKGDDYKMTKKMTVILFSAAFSCFLFIYSGCGKNTADELSLGEANENPLDSPGDSSSNNGL